MKFLSFKNVFYFSPHNDIFPQAEPRDFRHMLAQKEIQGGTHYKSCAEIET